MASDAIAGIGVDTTAATVLALDANDRHLRPAIMWMDVRASDQAERIANTGDPALKYNGFGSVSAEWGLPKCLWLKEQEPDDLAGSTAHLRRGRLARQPADRRMDGVDQRRGPEVPPRPQ